MSAIQYYGTGRRKTSTARVFLRLLPRLAERGIVTLGQAREASRASPLSGESF